ncbi:MAG: hypothetical protein Q7S98_03505 [Deltaproteobacteria bacterium]|nr:hypothetical protein [Deltaproteobacteria bacterium]
MGVIPFPFETLPKLTRQGVKLLEALSRAVPRFYPSSGFKESMEQFFLEHLGLPASIGVGTVSLLSYKEVLQHLHKKNIFAVLSLPPVTGTGFLEIDSRLAQVAIDHLLGGSGQIEVTDKSPTELDQGVLSYLVLKIISFLYETSGKSPQAHFRFEEFAEKEALDSFCKADEVVPFISFHVTVGEVDGYARLVLPPNFVQKLAEADPILNQRQEQAMLERMARLDFLPTTLWLEVGQMTISPNEMANLEKGDVVLFDETQVHWTPEKTPGGTTLLRVGTGKSVGMVAPIVATPPAGHGGKLAVRVEKILEAYG